MLTNQDLHDRVVDQTVQTRFLETLEEHGDRVAFRWKTADDGWGEWTFSDYAERVARATTGLAALGVERGQRVVIMMANRPEFHVVDLAVLMLGATPISIYNSSSPEQVQYLTSHCDATVAVVENAEFLGRFLAVRDELPALGRIGIVDESHDVDDVDVFTFASLLESEPADLAAAAQVGSPDDLATVIYTSGTTGPPKGVMLTQRNICWTVESLYEAFIAEIDMGDFAGKRIVSYLPMAHIAERATSHYLPLFRGCEVTTCPVPTLVAQYAAEVKPQIMFGVPRVLEKVYAGVNAVLAADPEKKQKFDEAIEAAIPIVDDMAWGRATEEQIETWNFLDAVAFAQVRELVGIDQLDAAITGAAPIPGEMLAWFRAIGVPLSEIYGMSESSGPMTWAAGKVKFGSVGPAIPGCEVKLAQDGEIICRGGNVFAGYLNAPEQTADTIDEDGWLHSGDIGEIDDDGYFTIVDRKKELIITAGGKNISPSNLEAALKMIPLVGQAMAVGDNKPFVAALVVLDPDAAPAWAAANGIEEADLTALASHPDVEAAINDGLADVMAHFNNAERVKKVCILGEEWLPDSQLLTPTSKLKRRGVMSHFQQEIDALYS